jgi:hypothetical protein
MEKITCIAEISIQGDRVLRFINSTAERAVYEIIDFDNPVITLIDYRQQGLKAIQKLLETNQLENFAPEFNTPAKVEIQSEPNGNILIELNETGDEKPAQMLWIAIGINEVIPDFDYLYFDYLFKQTVVVNNKAVGIVTLFDTSAPTTKTDTNHSESKGSLEWVYSK